MVQSFRLLAARLLLPFFVREGEAAGAAGTGKTVPPMALPELEPGRLFTVVWASM